MLNLYQRAMNKKHNSIFISRAIARVANHGRQWNILKEAMEGLVVYMYVWAFFWAWPQITLLKYPCMQVPGRAFHREGASNAKLYPNYFLEMWTAWLEFWNNQETIPAFWLYLVLYNLFFGGEREQNSNKFVICAKDLLRSHSK